MLKYLIHKLEGFPDKKTEFFFTETLNNGQEKVLNSDAFRQEILTNTYVEKGWFGRSKIVRGMYGLDRSLAEFYAAIMSGDERDTEEGPDHEIDLLVRVLKMPPGVLGSMNPGNPWYNISYDFLLDCYNEKRAQDLFGNNVHEYVHHLGFYHKTKIQSKRRNDPAYSTGRIARDLFSEETNRLNSIDDDHKWMNLACL